ncbi:TPA: hypothetical protein ACSPIW_005058, partial [Raoultella ornithinolytica]
HGITNEIMITTQKTSSPKITKTQLFRTVASSPAIETGISVEEIEQQLKRFQAQAKAVGLAR